MIDLNLGEDEYDELVVRVINVLKHTGEREGNWDGIIEYIVDGLQAHFWEDTSKLTPVVTYRDKGDHASGTTRYLRTKA